MKKLTCRDLGGPCEAEFTAFEEIGKQSRAHVMEQMQKRNYPPKILAYLQTPDESRHDNHYLSE